MTVGSQRPETSCMQANRSLVPLSLTSFLLSRLSFVSHSFFSTRQPVKRSLLHRERHDRRPKRSSSGRDVGRSRATTACAASPSFGKTLAVSITLRGNVNFPHTVNLFRSARANSVDGHAAPQGTTPIHTVDGRIKCSLTHVESVCAKLG